VQAIEQAPTDISYTSPAPRTPGAPTNGFIRAAVLAFGASTLFIVARDGSVPWQVVRFLVAVGSTWITYRAVARGNRAQRAGVAFAVGCAATAVGVGIGAPHLAKAGFHPMTAAGLVSLTSGLVLLGEGGVTLVRITRSWRRAIVIPGLLVAVFVFVWSLGQAVAATNVPRTSVGATTPGDRGLRYRDVEFETVDGVTLSGWYVPSTNHAAVVLLHGAGSTRTDVLGHGVVLARHGYGVLLFDARGHGRSGGRAMDFGWYGDEDTTAAVSFLRAQPDVDDERIAAVGMSMGGEEALGAAAADRRIRAVVAEGATNRVTGDRAWLSDEFGWRGAVQESVERLLYSTTDLLTTADPPIALRDAVAVAAPRPVLLIAGGAVADEGRAARHIQAASPDTVELWIVPETGHTGTLGTHPEQWEQHVTAFLADSLGM
jgi:pimeloyl-ACP methyl ester carboxylesterase